MSAARIVVVGDALLDRDVAGTSTRLSPDAPVPVVDVDDVFASPGGAGLAALLCAEPPAVGSVPAEVSVTLLAPVAADAAGHELAAALGDVALERLGHEGGTRTKTRVRSAGQTLLRVDEGGPGTPVGVSAAHVAAVLAGADAVLVSDYGGGITRDLAVRAALEEHARTGTVVWDPHPRGGEPVPGCALVTPNAAEAAGALEDDGAGPRELAGALRRRWSARAVAVTAGAEGAYLASAAGTELLPAAPVRNTDPCGAGDRFASAAALALGGGADVTAAVETAVEAAGQWVAAGGAATYRTRRAAGTRQRPGLHPGAERLPREVQDLLAEVRARGGTVVATGGCFDVLHAGHIASLDAARRLGDALVVLLNSDGSVRRLKGPGRPVVGQGDRARVLAALRSVDAVVVFDEDDPRAALNLLRPDVWVKGGDYTPEQLPEAADVRSWGGEVTVLPYLSGRSTTAILQRAGRER
ncbi:D-glycero-beta-D-manno-heptose 1-phosphate adenylyltransferase [Kocuria rosea]|uniref:D-glycero-beta-D-manno-heptose 1-phosphate adenylyltransferase n=1 Tax=Kocuria rosea TaxID=1275 RepID=UPI00203D92E8|nr:D-glycero-beta-D-manno-heptose 1-phosphate adenylyltransferase [Kocuria rosea]MCM3687113.1 D-glycero-beta-D-manno-heptose 1-phosphate adenylyltransferase [Kocuria rosea]